MHQVTIQRRLVILYPSPFVSALKDIYGLAALTALYAFNAVFLERVIPDWALMGIFGLFVYGTVIINNGRRQVVFTDREGAHRAVDAFFNTGSPQKTVKDGKE